MSEWWTYRPHDLLMYSARAYYRLFVHENARVWPGQVVVLVFVLVFVLVLVLGNGIFKHGASARSVRLATAGLATAWGFVAWSYFVVEYSTIHTFARVFAGMFLLEAILLAVAARNVETTPPKEILAARVGWVLFGLALVVQPLVGIVLGRPWRGAELFGLAPDPTVAATFGILLLCSRSPWLWAVPIVWAVYNGTTLQLLGSPDALILPAIALIAVGTRFAMRRATARIPLAEPGSRPPA